MKIQKLLSLVILSFTCITAYSQVSGIVFRDFNANGVRDNSATFTEPLIKNITVKAYNASNTLVGTTTTSALGAYSFTGLTLPLRIEFSGIQDYDYTGPRGTSNATSVQFYTAASTTANFSVNYPTDYAQTNPELATSIYKNGAANGTENVLVKWPYSNTGNTGATTNLATRTQIGSTWGLAFDRTGKQLFSSSWLKRHVGLPDLNSDSKGDLGNIFVTNTTTNATTLWKDLTTLGIDFGTIGTDAARGLGAVTAPSNDPTAFPLIGKVGIGDIDLSDDGNTLYLTNLFDKKLYAIDVATKTLINSWAIPQSCTNNDVVNMGLKFYQGNLYAGQVCTAQTSNLAADLKATIYKFDGTVFTSVLTFPLNYPRGQTWSGCAGWGKWNPWIKGTADISRCNTFNGADIMIYPQAILSDIEFDPSNGNIIFELRDVLGDQYGHYNYKAFSTSPLEIAVAAGDILTASFNSSTNQYVLENNGTVGGLTSYGPGNGQGPGGGEFYYFDATGPHEESVKGSLALLPGIQEVVTTSLNPTVQQFTGGVRKFNTTNGVLNSSFQLYAETVPGVFGKVNGLGDLELLADPAPIEIGNRVWVDTDGDGIQDAGEAALAGVTVQLLDAVGTVLSTATTDANGNYIFSSATGTSTAPFRYGLAITTNTSYTVRVPNVQGGSKQVAIGTNSLTANNTDNTNGDIRDSDGTMVGDNADIVITTGGTGANNHTYDFGFSMVVPCSSTVTATPGTCNPANSQYTVTGQVTLTNPPASGTVTVQIVGGGSQTFTLPQTSPIAYSIAGQSADGASHTVNVTISGVSCASTVDYTAPASCMVAPCSSTITATPGSCNPANNQYAVSGQVTLTNPPASGTVTVQIVGGGSQTFTLPQTSPIAYNIAGQSADGASHTVNMSISGVSCASTVSYTAPASCMVGPCSATVTATPGACDPADNQYIVSGQVTLTNPPSSGTVTVQIVGAASQTFNLPQASPIAYSIAGQNSDGASHTVNVTISGVSCSATVDYTAPATCSSACQPVTIKRCTGETVELVGLDGMTNYKWYIINGPGDTVEVATGQTYVTANAGNYIYKAIDATGCPVNMCCPVMVQDSTCACEPITIKRCAGQSVELVAADGMTNYKWYIINGPGDTVEVATGQIFVTTNVGTYFSKATDNGCPAKQCCPVIVADSACCVIDDLNLVVGTCDSKGTASTTSDDEYSFTLNPTGMGIGTTYSVSGLPNSPQVGTYGSATTFGPYLINAGVLNIAVIDDNANNCIRAITVIPPASCSACSLTPPLLSVTDNVCPRRTGSINLLQDCGSGSVVQYSVNNGTTWSVSKPLYTSTARTILARCVSTADPLCTSTVTTVTTAPQKCINTNSECVLSANVIINPCNNNGTTKISSDDYFTIQVNATVVNGGSKRRYEVVNGADQVTGTGGNTLNSGGTEYGASVLLTNPQVFFANGTTSYQLVVRDIENNACLKVIDIAPVASCSPEGGNNNNSNPCYPVPCVPIQLNKN